MPTLLATTKRLDEVGSAVTTPSAITNTVTLADGSGNLERLTWQNLVIALGARAAADLANVQLAYTESGKIPSSLLNITGFEFQGDYNPATNTPALADTDTGKVNWVYRITGSANPTARDFGSGSINCSDDEYLAYSGASGSGAWINIGTGPLQQIATGGTGATTASQARTNLGVAKSTVTFVPTISFGGGTTGIAYGTQSGRAIIDDTSKEVLFWGRITLTNKGSSTGSAEIDLNTVDFTFKNEATINTSALVNVNMDSTSGLQSAPSGVIRINTVEVKLVEHTAGGEANLDDTNFTNTTTIKFSGTAEIE